MFDEVSCWDKNGPGAFSGSIFVDLMDDIKLRPLNTNICSSPSAHNQTGAPLSDIQGEWTHSIFPISDLLISRLCCMKSTLFACCFQPVIRKGGLCLCAAPHSYVCSDTSCLHSFFLQSIFRIKRVWMHNFSCHAKAWNIFLSLFWFCLSHNLQPH